MLTFGGAQTKERDCELLWRKFDKIEFWYQEAGRQCGRQMAVRARLNERKSAALVAGRCRVSRSFADTMDGPGFLVIKWRG